jgi:hypothetical protein
LYGEIIAEQPEAVTWGPGHIDVLVRGTDHTKRYDNGWQDWVALGGELVRRPTAICWGFGRTDVFDVGLDTSVRHLFYDGTWHPWRSLREGATSIVAPCSWREGHLDIFVRGTDSQIHHSSYDGHWRNHWESTGVDIFHGSPNCVSRAAYHLEVIAVGSDSVGYTLSRF